MSHNSNNQSFSFSFGFFSMTSARTFAHPQFYKCYTSVTSSLIFTTFTLASFLFLLPLCSLILYVGIQQWRKQRQTSRAKAVNHSDFITYNIVAMEPIGLLGCTLYCVGIFTVKTDMMEVGIYTLFLVYLGRLLLQCLTCVEQYLAVIHPVTYLRMKTGRGIMVRNASIACIWLICLLVLVFSISFSPSLPITPFFAFFAIGLLVIFYCSLSVLLALFRPGPGDVVGEKRRVNQSKRAFLNILFITVITSLKYSGLLVCTTLHASRFLNKNDGCIALMSAFWFCLPSSLSIPLLFLHRVKVLPCFRVKIQKGIHSSHPT